MAKKCSFCGFANNPEDAHFCGKCGKNIASYGYLWRLYNFSLCTPIEDSKLKEYKRYEQEAKSSIWKKIRKRDQDFWAGIGMPEWLIGLLWISFYIIIGSIVGVMAYFAQK